jgi:hypothetical protein
MTASAAAAKVQAARAHCYVIILRSFVAEVSPAGAPLSVTGSSTWAVCVQVAAPTDAGVRNALHRLCRLFALSHLQDNAGEWIGILSASQLALVLCLARATPAVCGLMRDSRGRSARPCASCLLKSARMQWRSAMCVRTAAASCVLSH